MDVAYPKLSDISITGEQLIVRATGKQGDVALGDAGGFLGHGKAVTIAQDVYKRQVYNRLSS